MERVNVFDLEGNLVGWFDEEKAEKFSEAERWDGSNNISIPTGSQWNHEELFRTAGGRWVLHWYSQYEGRPDSYRFITDHRAREWLLLNQEDEAVKNYFGEIEDERGPGRPEIGPAVLIRLPEELLTALDRKAEGEGISRAEIVRRLLSDVID